MDERDWLRSTDPEEMLQWVHGRAGVIPAGVKYPISDRKLRLYACACCRIAWEWLHPTYNIRVVEVAEAVADGVASVVDLERLIGDCGNVGAWLCPGDYAIDNARAAIMVGQSYNHGLSPTLAAVLRDMISPFHPLLLPKYFEEGDWVEAIPPFVLACGSGMYPGAVVVSTNPFALVSDGGDMLWTATVTPDNVRRMGRAKSPREAYKRWRREKDEYEPLSPSPVYKCPWLTPLVRRMAESIYQEADGALNSDSLAILADACEDAGCEDERVLKSLRGFEPETWTHYEPPTVVDWHRTTVPRYRGYHVIDELTGRL